MTPQVTTMPRREALGGLGRAAGPAVATGTDVSLLLDAIGDLKARAEHQRQRGSVSTAAYMLGRASRWPKAWLRRVMAQREEEYRELKHEFWGLG